jgi:hypothetical protein
MITDTNSEMQTNEIFLSSNVVEIDVEALSYVAGGDGTKSPFIGGS